MVRTRKELPARVGVAHLIGVGVLSSVCPRALIEEVLSDTGKASQRERRLPAPAVVYFVVPDLFTSSRNRRVSTRTAMEA